MNISGICGNIFDSKCTNLVPGKLFGQSGRLRICKPCEAIVYGNDDDSSVYSDEMERKPSYSKLKPPTESGDSKSASKEAKQNDPSNFEAPSLGIPFARKAGENKRGSAVIEFTNEHSLARPSSSRSLKSISGLYRNPSHKRNNSKQGHIHQHMKGHSHRLHQDDRAPFQRDPERNGKSIPALHHDAIIDPELMPYLSDGHTSEDDSMSIFATLIGEAQSPGKDGDRSGLESLMGSTRRKAWQGDRGTSIASRDPDSISIHSRSLHRQKRRNLSVSSFYNPRSSPKRTKSNSLLKGFNSHFSSSPSNSKPLPLPLNGENLKVMRSATMRGAAAPAVELNQASLQHVKHMLRQMLQDAEIPDAKRWEKALMPILLQCTDDVNPDIDVAHDDIDIRQYIKLKKIPGAKPGDTAYVSGVVFTKNLALKSMPRSLSNPRILIVTFPIEYARHYSTFMSLDPVINQEKEFLNNLVKQIIALNPHVLLVEKTVSGIALGLLDAAGIAVVQNVKASVLNAVARCTQTELLSSRDQLSLDPSSLGKCASFDVKTYVYGDTKKSFIYLTGCRKDLGCTIVLRGADAEHLTKLKRLAEFMCYVVYNLKLETCVMRDEYVRIPTNISGGTLASAKGKSETESPESTSEPPSTTTSQQLTTKSESDGSQQQISSSEVTSPTTGSRQSTLVISAGGSSTTKVESEGYEYNDSSTSVAPSFYNELVEEHKTKIISASPFVKFMQPYLLTQARQQETKLAALKRLRDQYAHNPADDKKDHSNEQFELVQPEMVHRLIKKPSKQVRDFLFAVHDAEYDAAKHAYLTQKRQWEAYLQNNPSLFDPFNHQRIAFLYSMVNSKTNPCEGPVNIAIDYYTQHDLSGDFLPDISLGQYVRKLCDSGDLKCDSPDCDDTMFQHHRQYVHGEGQMTVTLQPYTSRIRGMSKTVLMWSVCRICGKETQVMPMSDNTQRYSFGKYLELTFWSTGLFPRAHDCPHDIHRDHMRYLQYNNVAVRVQYDHVQLYEIIVPRSTITWKVDEDLRLKNDQYKRFKSRLDRFMNSVKSRIESIHVDSMPPEKIEDCRAEVQRLRSLCKDDHERLTKGLQEQYMSSRWYEIIPLNRAARAIHENSIDWDEIFADFEDNFFPSEKDIKRMTALQIRKIFESATSFTSAEESPEDVEAPEAKEKLATPMEESPPEISRRISIMTPEDTKNVLASVIQEQQTAESQTSIPPETIMQSPRSDKLPPLSPTMHDLEGKEVKHLDLAVSSESPPATEADKVDSQATQSLNIIDPQDLELSGDVSRTVEKMRANLDPNASPDLSVLESSTAESKIPRRKETTRRQMLAVAPVLSRTKSQPYGALLKPIPAGLDNSDSASISTVQSKSEKLKNLLVEPARAFERRMASARSKPQPSMIPRSVPGKRNVFNLARHYEQLSREFEKQRLRDRQFRESRGAYPLASAKPIVEVFRDAHEAANQNDAVDEADVSTGGRPSLDDTNHDETSTSKDPSPDTITKDHPAVDNKQNIETQSMASQQSKSDEADQSAVEDDDDVSGPSTEPIEISPSDSQIDLIELQKQEKTSLLKLLTNFWGERSSSGWTQLDYPFAASEHVWGDSDIIVREDEPSSIIALTLASADYQAKLKSFRREPADPTPEQVDQSIERNLMHSKNTNIRYVFENRGVKAQCKIFYAESFDALRRKTGVSERFVESLSRCLKWDSKGGKTKSLFLKTLDDRFVLKSLSPVEVNAFFKFAPDYFAFVHAILYDSLPSVIAKMFGVFQVTIRSPSGLEFNWFMLVMENLFYHREPSRRFDLKGSMRNRKIQSTGERDEVLLDENLVDIIFEKPIFVREHTMKLLKASVWNDTLFLSKQNVMDYSLMAGFEDEMREIVVGIIDCIRTYTWDKKLETWIKDRGKNKPTVTSPKDYRNRFRVAMSKYILLAPNCWHQFQAQQIQGRPVRLRGGGKAQDELLVAGVDVKDVLNISTVGGD
jgi:1-phosphatidylinositol-3-phosphate 5-kinase